MLANPQLPEIFQAKVQGKGLETVNTRFYIGEMFEDKVGLVSQCGCNGCR